MLPRPTAKYVGYGPLTLARMTHAAEDAEDDIEFLAIQDAVETLTPAEREHYRRAYIEMHKPAARRRLTSDQRPSAPSVSEER